MKTVLINQNVNVEFYLTTKDIMNAITQLDSTEVRKISKKLNEMGYYESGINIPMNNLYDEMKMQTLIDLYNIYTLEELTQLKNKK